MKLPAHMLDIALMLAETTWLSTADDPSKEDEVLEAWGRAREAIRRGEPVEADPDPDMVMPAPTAQEPPRGP